MGWDPAQIRTREEFRCALVELKDRRALSVREVVKAADRVLAASGEKDRLKLGTLQGWYTAHLPTIGSRPTFMAVLSVFGVDDEAERARWWSSLASLRDRPATDSVPPYRGLDPFQSADEEWFFGRTADADGLLERVATLVESAAEGPRLLFVIGASGSGKSSLLRAGLVPRLVRYGIDCELMVPGVAPAKTLEALGAQPVVIVDQFEEIWTMATNDERAELLESITSRPGRVCVLGMRADFFDQAARQPELNAALNDHPVVVGPMGRDQLREVIVGPARHARCDVEPALVELLLGELAPETSGSVHNTGLLPLLSYALLQAWNHSSKWMLSVEDYRAVGGLSDAVKDSADRVLKELSPRDQDYARRIFMRLTNFRDAKPTRRRLQLAELEFDEVDTTAVWEVVEAFARARLVTVDRTTVEITHEALLVAWGQLGRWIQADRDSLAVHQELAEAAIRWNASGDRGDLMTGGRLAAVLGWTDTEHPQLNRIEREFVAASEANELRQRRFLVGMSSGLALLLVIALVTAALAWAARVRATEAVDDEAARAAAIQSSRLQSADPALAQQVALAGLGISAGPVQIRSALLDSVAVGAPERTMTKVGEARLSVSADGLVAVSSGDRDVRFLDLDGGRPLRVSNSLEPVPTGEPSVPVAFEPGSRVFAVGGTGTASVWEVGSGGARRLSTLSGFEGGIRQFAWTGDGQLLAVTGREVLRWKTPRISSAHSDVVGAEAEVSSIAVSGGSGLVAVAGTSSAQVQVFGWGEAGRLVPMTTVRVGEQRDAVRSMAFNPRSPGQLAVATAGGVWLIDVGDPAVRVRLSELGSTVTALSYSPDGASVAVADADGVVRVYDIGSGRSIVWPTHSSVSSLGFGPGFVVAHTFDGLVRKWSWPVNFPMGPEITAMGSDRAGKVTVAAVGGDVPSVRLLESTSGIEVRERSTLPLAPGALPLAGVVAISGDGQRVVAADTSGNFHVWDVGADWAVRYRGAIGSGLGEVTHLAISGAGDRIAGIDQSHDRVVVVGVDDHLRVDASFSAGNLTRDVAFSPDGGQLAVAMADQAVTLWDLHGSFEAPEHRIRTPGMPLSVSYSPDGPRLLAVGTSHKRVRMWSVDDAVPQWLADLDGPPESVRSVRFDPTGGKVAADVGERGIWIWKSSGAGSFVLDLVLEAHPGMVNGLVFGPVGSSVAAGGVGGTVWVWPMDVAQVRDRLCRGDGGLSEDEWVQYLPDRPRRDPCR